MFHAIPVCTEVKPLSSVYVMQCSGMQNCSAVTACVHGVSLEVGLTLMASAHDMQITHGGHAPSICETLRQKQVSPTRSRFCPPEAMTGGAPETCSPLEPLHQMQLGLSRTVAGFLLQWHLPAATAIGTMWPQASQHYLYAQNWQDEQALQTALER